MIKCNWMIICKKKIGLRLAGHDWFDVNRSREGLEILLKGEFRAQNAFAIVPAFETLGSTDLKHVRLDLSQIEVFDITGVWIIERFLRTLKSHGIQFEVMGANQALEDTLSQIRQYKFGRRYHSHEISPFYLWLEEVGRAAYKVRDNSYHMVAFLGQLVITLFKTVLTPQRIRWVSIVAIMNRVGLNALPIVGMISFLLGVVLVYQGSYQLEKFGAEIFTVDLLAVSFLREIGILLTAIIIAGRSGSAFAAQIGTMKLNQEVDALNTFGLDPMEILVLPRVIALVISMPLLAFYSDMVGLFGGAMMSYIALDISYDQFFAQLSQAINPWTFWVGVIKAPVFGFVIALVGCYEGLQVEGNSLSVGRKTTKSVVEAIFLVIVFDAIFSVMFTLIGI